MWSARVLDAYLVQHTERTRLVPVTEIVQARCVRPAMVSAFIYSICHPLHADLSSDLISRTSPIVLNNAHNNGHGPT